MRIALAQANATGTLVQPAVSRSRALPPPDLCEHASGLFLTAINGTQNALSPEAVERGRGPDAGGAGRCSASDQGGSMLLANDICARFASLSTKFRTAGDSHLQMLAASLMGPEADVVLFISYSGATRDMLETLRTAKASGAKIILLTHYEDSPGAAHGGCGAAVRRAGKPAGLRQHPHQGGGTLCGRGAPAPLYAG